MCTHKKILIGVCGGIAAYKIAYLVRMLKKAGAEVKVILTPDAHAFVTPLTLSTLSQNEVYTALYDSKTGKWTHHVELALWADVFLIAPCTANTLAKMANGICDNLLMTVYLSAKCPVCIAPAMDLDMWKHTATQKNISTVKNYPNHYIIAPEHGELASGLVGEGRMASPEIIFEKLNTVLHQHLIAQGLHVLITAGPTFEAIDPVRFIGNHSSGKMGFELAKTWVNMGATVTLIAGPVQLPYPENVKLISVQSAAEMLAACEAHFPNADITIMSAAVADYTPVEVASQKIKKSNPTFAIELKKTTDILQKLGSIKSENQFLMGFALETQNEIENAIGKLQRKNLDAIVLNSMNDPEAGFQKNTNKITIIDKNLNQEAFPAKTKTEVALDICNFVLKAVKK